MDLPTTNKMYVSGFKLPYGAGGLEPPTRPKHRGPRYLVIFKDHGGAGRTRTPYLLIANETF
jgi:hypothetical protein